jgi:hypothetical protein
MHADGSHVHALTPRSCGSNEAGPVFSPNGKRIAYHLAKWHENHIHYRIAAARAVELLI